MAFKLRISNFTFLGLALTVGTTFTGCLGHKRVTASRRAPSPTAPAAAAGPPAAIGQGEEGIASWYGRPYHGRPTASGEIYNMYTVSAAHRTLPFGARVRVHNLDNGRDVVVRINDRGPFLEGRIIDLSYAAARAIHMDGPGTARVKLEIVGFEPGSREPGMFAVQVGAFKDRANAEQLKLKIASLFEPVVIESFDRGDGLLHRVRVGREMTEEQARTLARSLRDASLTSETFVVRMN